MGELVALFVPGHDPTYCVSVSNLRNVVDLLELPFLGSTFDVLSDAITYFAVSFLIILDVGVLFAPDGVHFVELDPIMVS